MHMHSAKNKATRHVWGRLRDKPANIQLCCTYNLYFSLRQIIIRLAHWPKMLVLLVHVLYSSIQNDGLHYSHTMQETVYLCIGAVSGKTLQILTFVAR